jgi:hypothetical protein
MRSWENGFPLSPYLFQWVAKGLVISLKEALRVGTIKDIHIGSSCTSSHLLFVDDIFIFYEGSRRGETRLKEIIELYYIAIGMYVNMGKSTIFYIVMFNDDKYYISNINPYITL